MFGFPADTKKEFWRWLAKQRQEIFEELESKRTVAGRRWGLHELGIQLKKVDENLVHELGLADQNTIELIVSADGIKATFPAVISLVKSAPPLTGFKITAFRPRSPPGFVLHVAGQEITDEALSYRLVPEGDELGLELFIDRDVDEKLRTMIGFLSLDQRLGEYDVAMGLKWIEFAGGRPADARPIAELANEFDSLRRPTPH